MKKLFLLCVLALICIGSLFAADDYKDMKKAPPLDVDGAYIIDLKPFRKKIEDNITFLNMSEKNGIAFIIYYIDYDTGEWVKNINRGFVKVYNDRDIVELDKRYITVTKKDHGIYSDEKIKRPISLKKIPFIAIVTDPAGNYEFKIYPKSSDIYIEIVSFEEKK